MSVAGSGSHNAAHQDPAQAMRNPPALPPRKTLWQPLALLVSALLAPPGQATAAAPELAYESALADYVPYTEQAVQPWEAANDRVGEIGGWRAYAREMRQTAPASGQPPPTPGHGAHSEHKP